MILRRPAGHYQIIMSPDKILEHWPQDAGADNMPQSGKISNHPLPRQDWDDLNASIIIGVDIAAVIGEPPTPPEGTFLVLFPFSHSSWQKCVWPFHWNLESRASSHKISLMHVINIWWEVHIWWRDHKCSNTKVKSVYEALWVNKYTGGWQLLSQVSCAEYVMTTPSCAPQGPWHSWRECDGVTSWRGSWHNRDTISRHQWNANIP